MTDQPFTNMAQNMPKKIKAVRAKYFGQLIAKGVPAALARTEADSLTRRHYDGLLKRYAADYPQHAPFAYKIARRHLKGI